ncbi:hypothetical protein L6270_04535 [Candidatus Parcubacteria bacterium]|nr:hypothetical protein [Patescibacteria group bacterium]MBU4309230.1 hypothetical protein [Patescibacteria group bacterium]MBU4432326.1 hypothetical protein [Patescibacteria group bacterium]MBU4577591.1 hypothetical protein [Patescibacteria group bacterium]MCG2697278.1 hypothetical protein [Candidatus Parcubacteria bacterium]
MKKQNYAIFLVLIMISLIATKVKADAFNPNNIITDQEILDSSSMSLEDIRNFLNDKGGYISKNLFKDYSGKLMTTAEIIYNAANNFDCDDAKDLSANPSVTEKQVKCRPVTINPKFLMVLLQKEQSLITDTSPTQRQLDFACGYGCPDGVACNNRWTGIGKQINSASLQFYDYVKNPQNYGYKAGNTYTFRNSSGHADSVVTIENNATAGLYNYTPHVYNGNFNFFNLWMKYFSRNYPNGTLMQAKGEGGVWMIQNGKKRPFLSRGALTSRFDTKKIITVSKSVLDSYPKGAGIKFPQYSVVRSPRGTIFLIVDDKKRGFSDGEAFRKVGINPEEVVSASWTDLNAYEDGANITATSTYPTGALLQDKKTGGIYWVSDGTKAPLWDAILLKTKFKYKSITPVDSTKLASYTTVAPAIFGDGELIKPNNSPAVFVIDQGKRRLITSGELFEDMGYKWDNIIAVTPKILALYEEGLPLIAEPVITDPGTSATSTPATSTPAISTTATSTATMPATPVIPATTTDSTLQSEINSILNP